MVTTMSAPSPPTSRSILGRFTHYNSPITADNILTGIGLSITVDGILCDDNSVPTEGSTQTFDYTFTHEETPNDPANNPGGVCPYGDSTGNGCDDRVTVSQQPDTTFTCPEGERTVQILGFIPGANCEAAYTPPTVNTFVTGEGQSNPACLWARISDPTNPLAITLASFEASGQTDRIVVSWETVSELHNAGFNLYRSLNSYEAGERLNAELIPSQAPGSAQGASLSVRGP
ncbi:MAG: choice-of-anchor K domain-containing protein [Caldilineales bacterium]